MEEISFLDLLLNASFIVKLVMALLLMLSILGWTIIVSKYQEILKIEKKHRVFKNLFNTTNDLEKLYQKFSLTKKYDAPLTNLFLISYKTAKEDAEHFEQKAALIEMVEKKAFLSLDENVVRIKKHVSILATIGSVSPYIGLFGTVWGIMNAFIGLSAVQQTTIATVAPGIAEALVATAIGLFAAIPALVAYNLLLEKIATIINDGEHFIQSFINLLNRS